MGIGAKPHEDVDGVTAGTADGSSGEDVGGEARPTLRRVVHPGQVLGEELAALGLSLSVFVRQIAVPTSDVSRIVNRQRLIAARMALAQSDLTQAERASS